MVCYLDSKYEIIVHDFCVTFAPVFYPYSRSVVTVAMYAVIFLHVFISVLVLFCLTVSFVCASVLVMCSVPVPVFKLFKIVKSRYQCVYQQILIC